jgi:hypothetical protein
MRSNVFLGAVLDVAETPHAVRVRNLAIRGALLEGAELPTAGTGVRLRRGTLAATGEIAWAEGAQRGVRFDGTIDVSEWIRPAGHAGQQWIDSTIAALRTNPRALNLLVPDARKEQESLDSLVAELEQVCERLAAVPDLSTDAAEQLIKLDAIGTAIRRIARLSRAAR